MAQKKFQDLDLKDAFLFAAALSDEETCRMLLEVILEEKIGRVQVHAEHTLLFSKDYRSIRLDIYAQDEASGSYNVEMQGENKGNLPKRSRYHQAEMDLTSLRPGEDFNALRPCCIIFLCTFDPFGKGLYRYTFENRCKETDLGLGDGTRKIFLNTRGCNDGEVSAALRSLLHYVEDSTDRYVAQTEDVTVKQLHEKVTALKKSREWERRYMTLEEMLTDARKEGHEAGLAEGHEAGHRAGLAEGENRMALLIQKMSQAGESDKLALLSDPAFLQEMYQKYQISSNIQ